MRYWCSLIYSEVKVQRGGEVRLERLILKNLAAFSSSWTRFLLLGVMPSA